MKIGVASLNSCQRREGEVIGHVRAEDDGRKARTAGLYRRLLYGSCMGRYSNCMLLAVAIFLVWKCDDVVSCDVRTLWYFWGFNSLWYGFNKIIEFGYWYLELFFLIELPSRHSAVGPAACVDPIAEAVRVSRITRLNPHPRLISSTSAPQMPTAAYRQ